MRENFDYSSIILPEGWTLKELVPADPGEAPYLAINPSGVEYHLNTSDGYHVQAFCRDRSVIPGVVSLPIDPLSSEAPKDW